MNAVRVVMKFGGTSLADAVMVREVARIVAGARPRQPAVVLSAAAGVTDALVRLLEVAPAGEAAPILADLAARHRKLLDDLELPPDLLDERLAELGDLAHGVGLLGEVTPRTCDRVLSYGEYLLVPVFAEHLRRLGLPARAWIGGDLGLITDDRFTRARPLPECYERIAETLRAAGEQIPIVTGFLGRTREGEATTLGRGGSDYSASILARAVGAEELQIWTDVDGILTADPRIVPDARLIERLTFREASELAYSGAKVLHPSTITPAMEGRIPVRVLNSRRPERAGTLILGEGADDAAPEHEGRPPVRSIAHKTGARVITIVSPRMLARHGFMARIAEVFDRHATSIDMISTTEVSVSLTTGDSPARIDPLLEELREFSQVEVEERRGMVSVVGERLGESIDLVGEVFRCVAAAGAEVEMISYGATRTNLSFLVAEEMVPAAVAALHRRYFDERAGEERN